MENKNEPKKKMSRGRELGIISVAVFIVFMGIGLVMDYTERKNPPASSPPPPVAQVQNREDSNKQQDDIRNMYEMSRDATKRFMETANILGSIEQFARDQKTYNALKAEEDYYKNISGEMMLVKSPVPSHLKEFGEDIGKSFDDISTASAINQNVCRYLAEYIRTADMEYQRKAEVEMNKKPLAYAVSATNRLISIAEKVGLDSEAMKKEMDGILQNNK